MYSKMICASCCLHAQTCAVKAKAACDATKEVVDADTAVAAQQRKLAGADAATFDCKL